MTGWIVLACVLLVLFLISRIRLGGKAEYSAEGFLAWVKVGPALVQVFPAAEKKSKEKPKKEEKAKAEEPETPQEEKKGGSFALLKEMLPLVMDAVGRILRAIRVDMLYLDFTSAGQDAAAAAMGFGYANAAIGMIWPILEQNLRIKDRRIRTRVDFQQTQPTVYLLAQVTLTVGQLIALAVVLGIRFLKRYLAYRANEKARSKSGNNNQKEAVSHGEQAASHQ